jgi:hypothetical protein
MKVRWHVIPISDDHRKEIEAEFGTEWIAAVQKWYMQNRDKATGLGPKNAALLSAMPIKDKLS